jgi:hypothetical protein
MKIFFIRLQYKLRVCALLAILLPGAFVVCGKQSAPIEIFVYQDTASNLTFDAIRSDEFQNLFKKLNSLSLRYYESNSAIWIKFRMQENASDLLLAFSSPNLHFLDYYRPNAIKENTYVHYETGFLRDFSSRPIATDKMGLPFTANNQWHFVRLQSGHFLNT